MHASSHTLHNINRERERAYVYFHLYLGDRFYTLANTDHLNLNDYSDEDAVRNYQLAIQEYSKISAIQFETESDFPKWAKEQSAYKIAKSQIGLGRAYQHLAEDTSDIEEAVRFYDLASEAYGRCPKRALNAQELREAESDVRMCRRRLGELYSIFADRHYKEGAFGLAAKNYSRACAAYKRGSIAGRGGHGDSAFIKNLSTLENKSRLAKIKANANNYKTILQGSLPNREDVKFLATYSNTTAESAMLLTAMAILCTDAQEKEGYLSNLESIPRKKFFGTGFNIVRDFLLKIFQKNGFMEDLQELMGEAEITDPIVLLLLAAKGNKCDPKVSMKKLEMEILVCIKSMLKVYNLSATQADEIICRKQEIVRRLTSQYIKVPPPSFAKVCSAKAIASQAFSPAIILRALTFIEDQKPLEETKRPTSPADILMPTRTQLGQSPSEEVTHAHILPRSRKR